LFRVSLVGACVMEVCAVCGNGGRGGKGREKFQLASMSLLKTVWYS